MDAAQRKNLTDQLSRISAAIAADLRARMLEPGPVNERARQLHADERVGDAFELWTDLLSRRAAVLWVLKSVYVRVLEDRGLLRPLRIVDRSSQGLFERLAPSLGETAYLKWVYRDLASSEGGLPELFGLQPAEIALPSNDLSKQLLELWRGRDQDTGELVFRFDDEHFDGRLMGDLYQDLDPVVKKRFALLQTPDFVVDFILDETLTPAIAEYGVENVRVLDPSCGSGHFLLAAFKRLVREREKTARARGSQGEKTAGAQGSRGEGEKTAGAQGGLRGIVTEVLGQVVGIDLNDYACGLARARLVMTALELCGETELGAASGFHPQVFWADALEQVERDELGQMTLPTMAKEEKPAALMTRPEVRAALRPVLKGGFHVVVGNPPYITEKDASRRAYHREKLGKQQRYISASRTYSLAAPFTERMLQVAVKGGFVGQITTNAFLKREFGKALIQDVLARHDIYKVVDTSGAYLPGHGTPTVLLFVRNRQPTTNVVPVIMGKRGEPGKPADPAKGKVWTSIAEGHRQIGFESEFVSVNDVARTTLAQHPWSIGGGGAAELKTTLEGGAAQRLAFVIEAPIGRGTRTGDDDAFAVPLGFVSRTGASTTHWRPLLKGEDIRDWGQSPTEAVWFPYSPEGDFDVVQMAEAAFAQDFRRMWPFRTGLARRATFQGVMADAGLLWYEYMQFTPSGIRTPLSIAFAFKATHNHFVLDRGGKVFKQTAPVIKLPPGSSVEEHLALLGQLNSSTGCFWMKQVCQTTGGPGGGKISKNDYENFYEHDGTKLQSFPLATQRRPLVEAFSAALDRSASKRVLNSVRKALHEAAAGGANDLRAALDARRQWDLVELTRMVALQEELDWLCYKLYGIDADVEVRSPDHVKSLTPGQRPFEIALAREDAERREAIERGEEPDEAPTAWFERHGWTPVADIDAIEDPQERAIIASRMERTAESKWLSLVEQPTYKRRWYRPDYEKEEQEALRTLLADRVEDWSKALERPWTIKEAALALETDPAVLAVAELIAGRSTFDLATLLAERVQADSVPGCKVHVFTEEGLRKRALWEATWEMQRREDAGEKVTPAVPPKYDRKDFLRTEYWSLRGKLDVPKERFIALTEVPTRANGETLYGWAGWTHRQRAKVLLQLDEDLENEGVPLPERYAILYQVGFLIPYVEWESPKAAAEFRAVVTSLVGQEGVTEDMLRAWAETHPLTRSRATGTTRRGPRATEGVAGSESTATGDAKPKTKRGRKKAEKGSET
jgi:hypothetical protein